MPNFRVGFQLLVKGSSLYDRHPKLGLKYFLLNTWESKQQSDYNVTLQYQLHMYRFTLHSLILQNSIYFQCTDELQGADGSRRELQSFVTLHFQPGLPVPVSWCSARHDLHFQSFSI